jgi:dTDP-4-dehydrorhamnose reductase
VVGRFPDTRWLVTGAGGQLGRCLCDSLRGIPGRALDARDRSELDVTDAEAVRRAVERAPGGPPHVVINAAAMTQVDLCESEPERAERVNARAPGLLAGVCKAVGAKLVHVSTDYVFDGAGSRPYREHDATAPRSVYGRTKLEGEHRALTAPGALVVRSAWVFGPGRNFVRTILEAAHRHLAGAGPGLRVVDDQHGSPTYAGHLAAGLVALVEQEAAGLYHLANSGAATWWDVARAAVDAWGHPELPVEKVRTEDVPRPAPRPAWSVLDVRKAERAGVSLPSWREGLRAYLDSAASPLRRAGGPG